MNVRNVDTEDYTERSPALGTRSYNRYSRITPGMVAVMKTLYEQGRSLRFIAAEMNVSYGSAYNHLRRVVTLRPRGGVRK